MKNVLKEVHNSKIALWFMCIFLALFTGQALAAGLTIGGMASSMTSSFKAVGNFLTGVSYLAGLFGVLGGIAKLKAHQTAPQQTTLSSGLFLLVIGAICLFLPTVLNVAGFTLFGSQGGSTAGPSGITFGS